MEELGAVMRSTGARKDAGKSGKRRWVSPPIMSKMIYNLHEFVRYTLLNTIIATYLVVVIGLGLEPKPLPSQTLSVDQGVVLSRGVARGDRRHHLRMNDLIRGKKVTASE